MKTKKTNRLRSAADRRVASGVARVFDAPRRVIVMVVYKRNYKLQKVCVLNLILFASITENMSSENKQFFPFKILISPIPREQEVQLSSPLHGMPRACHLTHGTN
jgi:hypothetical protein